MRGVAGLLFVFLGLVMGYLILTGRFPSSGSSASSSGASDPNAGNTAPAKVAVPGSANENQQANRLLSLNRGDGGNSLGLPTTKHMHDVAASQGGMR